MKGMKNMSQMKIGWIGTGVMGNAMCGHLLDAGYPMSVYNRTQSKADNLVAKGAQWCDNPFDVARNSDMIFSIVSFPSDVEQVMLGDKGAMAGALPNAVIVEMTTSNPSLARRIYQTAKDKGLSALDAPVSGGDIGAREGTLAIMAGGDKPTYEKALPMFKTMGQNIAYMGDAGSGQHTKMCNQILIAGTMIGTVESLIYAYRVGLDQDEVIDIIGKGAASSWAINNLGRRIANNDFSPGFFIKHFVKDMGIALDEAQRMNICLPGLALAQQFFTAAKAMGHENLGTQGLYKVLAHMNRIDT